MANLVLRSPRAVPAGFVWASVFLLCSCSPPDFSSFADRSSTEFGAVNALLFSASSSTGSTPVLTSSISSLEVREGTPGQYELSMAVEPSGTIGVDISFDAAQLMVAGSSVSPTRVSFDATNWNNPMLISVVAVDDSTTSGTRSSTITHTVVGGSALAPADLTMTIRDNELRIYATAGTWDGMQVGGITGADAKCNGPDGNKPAGSITWKAMITDGTNRIACTTPFCAGGESENVDWVMYSNMEYRRSDGTTVIATTQAGGIWTFNTAASVTPGLNTPWTGILNDWQSEAAPCANWAGTGGNANIGNSSVNTVLMINAGPTACSGARALYCVEQ